MAALQKKICLLGMFGVGKTSLVRRFVDNTFSDKYLSTVGVKVSRKRVALAGHARFSDLDLLIWDIASQDELQQVAKSYFRGPHGAIAVYDLTRPDTARQLETFCQSFLEIAPQARLVYAGNKSDLIDPATIDPWRGTSLPDFAAQRSFLTSAKTGDNVAALFQKLADTIVPHDE